MELFLLLLLLLSEKDGEPKRSLQRLLTLYKENRELLVTLADMINRPKGAEQENRSHGETGQQNILEEYLRRVNA